MLVLRIDLYCIYSIGELMAHVGGATKWTLHHMTVQADWYTYHMRTGNASSAKDCPVVLSQKSTSGSKKTTRKPRARVDLPVQANFLTYVPGQQIEHFPSTTTSLAHQPSRPLVGFRLRVRVPARGGGRRQPK